MGEVLNLRQARKARRRGEAQAAAAANRAKFGRTKAEKIGEAAEADRHARVVDGAKRERDPQA